MRCARASSSISSGSYGMPTASSCCRRTCSRGVSSTAGSSRWAWVRGAMTIATSKGPLGRPRGIGFGILMYIVTLGFYGWYWVFKTEEEMRQHTGEGLGGILALVVWILITPVMAFVIPSEVGKMYARDGQEPPMT